MENFENSFGTVNVIGYSYCCFPFIMLLWEFNGFDAIRKFQKSKKKNLRFIYNVLVLVMAKENGQSKFSWPVF